MDQAGRRVVVIDDDQTDRELIVRLLGSRYVVVQAATAAEGIEAHRDFRPECVLLDYRLPDMDGIDLLTLLAPQGAPVIMMTGQGDEEVAVGAMKAGAFDYLRKSKLDAGSLVSAINRAVEKSDLQRKLEDTRRELEDFVGVASQDLKSPLATIEGQLRATLDEAGHALPDPLRGFVDRSASVAGDLRQMIDQLIRYTKVGRDDGDLVEVDVNAALSAAEARLRDAIAEAGATVEAGRLPIVRGAASDLTQLMQNLLGNAIKFRGASPPVVRVSAELSGIEWEVVFSDNGIGIPEEHREAVFAPLRRLHGEDAYPGHGLGLATCRKIVRQHGGRIWVEESPGGGAEFRFTLPATAEQLTNWGRR